MTKDNEIGIVDRLNLIHDKMSFITTTLFSISCEDTQFSSDSMTGFSWILYEIQEEIKEVKKLIG